MSELKERFVKILEGIISDIKNDKCDVNDEQMEQLMSIVSHKAVSKDEACNEILHWSRSKFDEYVAMGLMPTGRKRRGWKELVWYKDELLKAKEELK